MDKSYEMTRVDCDQGLETKRSGFSDRVPDDHRNTNMKSNRRFKCPNYTATSDDSGFCELYSHTDADDLEPVYGTKRPRHNSSARSMVCSTPNRDVNSEQLLPSLVEPTSSPIAPMQEVPVSFVFRKTHWHDAEGGYTPQEAREASALKLRLFSDYKNSSNNREATATNDFSVLQSERYLPPKAVLYTGPCSSSAGASTIVSILNSAPLNMNNAKPRTETDVLSHTTTCLQRKHVLSPDIYSHSCRTDRSSNFHAGTFSSEACPNLEEGTSTLSKDARGYSCFSDGNSLNTRSPSSVTCRPTLVGNGQAYSDISDTEYPCNSIDDNNNVCQIKQEPCEGSDALTSASETCVTSDGSSDELSRQGHSLTDRSRIVPKKRNGRKLYKPRKSATRGDPKFKGATVWIQTDFKDGVSRLKISAFYSNMEPRVSHHRRMDRPYGSRSVTPIVTYSNSEPDDPVPVASTKDGHTVKTCASCKTRRTPLWRDSEDGTPLCNACGIRYKKYRLRCSRCWHIPKKDVRTYPHCPVCAALLRYSFQKKSSTW